MAEVEYAVLGPLEVRVAGTAVAVPAGHQRALLGTLLLSPGQVVPVDRLIDALWGDDPPAQARRALHTTLGRLRHTLTPAGVEIDYRPPGYVLRAPAGSRDCDTFQRLVTAARAKLDADPEAALAGFDQALALWRGPAWMDLADGVARGEAMRQEELRAEVIEDRASALLAVGRTAEGFGELEAAVAAHPLRERPVSALMRALAAHGRAADALATFSRFRTVIAEELGLDPSPALSTLYEQILRQEQVVREPAVRLPATPEPRPLPDKLASFIGRQEELRRLRQILADQRLITVIGPGGVGKSRLVYEAVRSSAGPVWWVDLEAVSDTDVEQAVADALGVAAVAGTPLAVTVRAGVAAMSGLLILDGCEHVVTPVADLVADLVAAGRGPTLVVTSRERLGLTGERVLAVGPLTVPPADIADETAPAVALFLDRARSVVPDFVADGPVVARIGDLCRALDGLPLAIELAAARIGTLSIDDLTDRLSERFDLLTTGTRSGTHRHRTLWSVVDWSYQLLTPPERSVLGRVAGFAAEFDLAAAEHVAHEPDVGPGRVADLVARLVDRSMLTPPNSVGPGRYRMLETIRQYVLATVDDDERNQVRERHALWCVELAERMRGGVIGPDEAASSDRLLAALADLRVAGHWAATNRRWDIGARLVAALWPWAQWRARTDVLEWGTDIVAHAPDHPLAPVAAAAAARAAWINGRMAQARAFADRGVTMTAPDHDPAAAAEPLEALGDIALITGDPLAAATTYADAAARFERRGDAIGAAVARGNETLALSYAGRDPSAPLTKLGATARCSRNPTLRAWTAYCTAEARRDEDPGWALTAYDDAARLADTVGNSLIAGLARTSAVSLLGRHGSDDGHLATFAEVVDEWRRTGNRTLLVTTLRNLLIFLSRRGDDREAAELAAALDLESSDNPSYGDEARRIGLAISDARKRLGPDRFARAWATGTGRNLDEAAEAALRSATRRSGAPQ